MHTGREMEDEGRRDFMVRAITLLFIPSETITYIDDFSYFLPAPPPKFTLSLLAHV